MKNLRQVASPAGTLLISLLVTTVLMMMGTTNVSLAVDDGGGTGPCPRDTCPPDTTELLESHSELGQTGVISLLNLVLHTLW